jgi:hypothetical protein
MPEAVRRNPVSKFRLGPVSEQLGNRFRCERPTTTPADPKRIVLLGSGEGRPHLDYVGCRLIQRRGEGVAVIGIAGKGPGRQPSVASRPSGSTCGAAFLGRSALSRSE